jgi:hypothetical protein
MRGARAGVAKVLACLLVACKGAATSTIAESRVEPPPPDPGGRPGNGGVLLELFTSEGCSSCPPADALLADLATDPRVVPLSFHVDYWNELGWPDRFSSPENTARQRAYAASFGTRGLYTPELVVGGVDGFVGSDRAEAEAAIAAALREPAPVTLSLRLRAVDGGVLEVGYSAQGTPPGSVMNVALVDREAVTQVRAGENSGRTLRHVNVVRAFATAPAASAGALRVSVPRRGKGDGEDVIAFVQAATGGGKGIAVLGVARAPLPARAIMDASPSTENAPR